MYKNGEGIAQDKEEAEKWFREAANQGHEAAKKSLKELEGKGVSNQ
jgi:TPR repeat protein